MAASRAAIRAGRAHIAGVLAMSRRAESRVNYGRGRGCVKTRLYEASKTGALKRRRKGFFTDALILNIGYTFSRRT